MSQSTLNVRIDKEIKKRFDAFCEDAGMNPSTAVNIFVRTVVRMQKIPFEVVGSDDPFQSVKNQSRPRGQAEQTDTGKGGEHGLNENKDGYGSG